MLASCALTIFALHMLGTKPVLMEYELYKTGLASYYSEEESGTITANGEDFNDEAFTIAMREGDFGEYYAIEYKDRKAICRLNDRGPYVKGRVVDLTKGVMNYLAKNRGLIKVRIYKIHGQNDIYKSR